MLCPEFGRMASGFMLVKRPSKLKVPCGALSCNSPSNMYRSEAPAFRVCRVSTFVTLPSRECALSARWSRSALAGASAR
jgi:hypothetical protein